MRKIDFETVNKKYIGITFGLRYCLAYCFRNIQLFFRSFRSIARACCFDINGTEYFFLKYFKSRDEHYKNDVKPILETWASVTIPPLNFHDVFDDLYIYMIPKLEELDPDGIGRDHLKAYSDIETARFSILKTRFDNYNQMVSNFIEDMNKMLPLEISQHAPRLEQYDAKRNQHSSVYYQSYIHLYVWRKFWNEDLQLEITPTRPDEFQLKAENVLLIIAVGDRESLESLRMYLNSVIPDIVAQLNNISGEREILIKYFQSFTETINMIIRNVSWNKGFKGRCGWERGFWSIT
jgi:hypothetical protein